jgi:hypothetical protein
MNIAELFQALTVLDVGISYPVLAVILSGLICILIALRQLRHRHLLKAGFFSLSGICLIFSSGLFLLLALNIHTYHRLTFEKPIAVLSTRQLGPQQYRVTVRELPDNKVTDYYLKGDEWQIDARILRWEPALQLLGLNTLYRLERLNGRYHQIDDELNRPRTVYSLSNEQGLDLWTLVQNYQQWLRWIDAYYGSAAYLPMHEGARYIISINQYGLIARPDNEMAKKALHNW